MMLVPTARPCRGVKSGRFTGLIGRDFWLSGGYGLKGVELIASRSAMYFPGQGRTLPLGFHRTRMSDVRGLRVCAAGRLSRRHPTRSSECIRAVRLCVSSG